MSEKHPDDCLKEADRPAYEQLRGKFLNDLPATLNTIEMLLADQQWRDLHREVHTLKGVLGTLVFRQTAKVVTEIEADMKAKGAEQCQTQIKALLKLLNVFYERHADEVIEEKPLPTIDYQQLNLNTEWLDGFRDAARLGRIAEIKSLLAELSADDANQCALQKALEKMLSEFDMKAMLAEVDKISPQE